MKKLIVLLLVMAAALQAAGCGKNVTLTNEQNDLIAEYVAGTMLKYSYDNEWKYAKLNMAQNTDVPKSTSAAQQPSLPVSSSVTTHAGSSTVNTGKTSPLEAMASELGLSNVTVTVKGVSVGDSYPSGQLAIAVPALPGYKVAAVEFNLKNNSDSEVTLNTSSGKVNMKLTVSGNNVTQSASILKNDINGLKGVKLAAKESYTAVAVFQVEESISAQTAGSTLTINSGSTSLGTVTVK
ncbi:MAG: hypothetical protein Q4F11_08885 [Eubacteriales bacterium]|nr:hypothetical protein [Eubacteriales bacterium]